MKHLNEWHQRTGKPVLWADGSKSHPRIDPVTGARNPGHDGDLYTRILSALRENPGCIGCHLCGAYLRNRVRNRGFRDHLERPGADAIIPANLETAG